VVRSAGKTELVVVPAGGGAEWVLSGDPDVVGVHPSGGGAHVWLPSGDSILYVARGGGLALVPAAGGQPTPVAVDADGSLSSPAVAPDGRRVAVTVDDRRVVAFPLEAPDQLVELTGGDGPDFVLDPTWSPDGERLAWIEWDVPDMPWDSARLVVADADGGSSVVVAGGVDLACQQPRWSAAGDLGFVCDGHGFANVWVVPAGEGKARSLVEEPFEHGEPAWGPGQRSWAWSPDGRGVAFCRNEAGFGRLCVAEVATGAVTELARGWHSGLSWAGGRLAAIRSGAVTPTQVVSYDLGAETGVGGPAPERVTLMRGPLAGLEDSMVEPEPVEWAAEDGFTIHGRLYRPPGPPTPRPTIVWIHGGPTGQMAVTFNARVGFFTSRGWTVLVPDYRGSSGWGRQYTQALRHRWGEIDVADVVSAMRVALDRGWSRPDALVVMGGSAGGFTALLVLAAHPELCAAGVDLYGVGDLRDLTERTHRYEAHYNHHLVGPLPEAEERYRARSPIAHAQSIRGPLLVLHGSDDEVVPVEQSLTLVEAVRSAGGLVEMHVYEGEGHGWSDPGTVADELARIEDFLARHVGHPSPFPS